MHHYATALVRQPTACYCAMYLPLRHALPADVAQISAPLLAEHNADQIAQISTPLHCCQASISIMLLYSSCSFKRHCLLTIMRQRRKQAAASAESSVLGFATSRPRYRTPSNTNCVCCANPHNWCAATATIARGINEVVCLLVICLFFNSSSLKQERVFAFNSSSFNQLQAPLLAENRELVTIVTA